MAQTQPPPSQTQEPAGMFQLPDGKNLVVTFTLVSSLFLLWGFCNGMIDVMDKHFQDELHLTKSQSAWVQFAHYLGYFLMAMPAGWLASKLGYKGGIIAGLLMVAVGGFWFLPATWINDAARAGSVSPTTAFIAFLGGVCAIAAGLTFLETIANPYTTVLGPPRYAATRINLAQSCNGVGWIFGPIVGAWYFYGKDAEGVSTGSQTLYIPYLAVAFVVFALAAVFYYAYIPDVKSKDDYHLDDSTPNVSHSIWSHPHFIFAVVAQFLYVAAQAGIFSFFVNYITEETPAVSSSWHADAQETSWWAKKRSEWFEVRTKLTKKDLHDVPALAKLLLEKPDALSAFIASKLSAETQQALKLSKDPATDGGLHAAFVETLNNLVKQDPKTTKPEDRLYDAQRFAGVKLSDATQKLLGETKSGTSPRLNRMLLADAFPKILPYSDGIIGISDSGAAMLLSIGFVCFLLGRFSGAGLLKKYSAHKVLGLYGALNVVACLAVFAKLGWLSAVAVFLSFFFMSIMFPTIFALGIYGLGARAKKASAFIVMAIMGGAVLPKLMGHIADLHDMSAGFLVPMVCFVAVALYGFGWQKLSNSDGVQGLSTTGGH